MSSEISRGFYYPGRYALRVLNKSIGCRNGGRPKRDGKSHRPTISAADREDDMIIVDEVKQEAREKHKKQKEAKAMNKLTTIKPIIETIKTIMITALITAIIAFIAGVVYQRNVDSEVQQRAKEIVEVSAATQSKE